MGSHAWIPALMESMPLIMESANPAIQFEQNVRPLRVFAQTVILTTFLKATHVNPTALMELFLLDLRASHVTLLAQHVLLTKIPVLPVSRKNF
jgi:hypothetical protein